jgi:transcription elongation GreA/GreB family factor
MSSAFVREPEGDVREELSERPVSTHPNRVTRRGFDLIVGEIDRLQASLRAARGEDDEQRFAELARDLRYWLARRANAEIVPPPEDNADVRFGHKVTIERDDGRRQTYKIVGEDEADPSHGLLSHISPLAVGMFGRKVGATVTAGHNEAEIVAIETTA